jgi:hypothetical protein
MRAGFEFRQPAANCMSLSIQMQEAGSSAANNQPPNISIFSLANPKQRLLATRRVFGWNNAKPRRHISRFTELLSIPGCSDESSRTEWSYAGN